ncbi:hypothetical protein EV286_10992 [Rhizobium sp. BK251]|nr:hypothetical protein EV286_10992 [Rhizobium sp. BK251]
MKGSACLSGRGEKALPVREDSPEARAGAPQKGGDIATVSVISPTINQDRLENQ